MSFNLTYSTLPVVISGSPISQLSYSPTPSNTDLFGYSHFAGGSYSSVMFEYEDLVANLANTLPSNNAQNGLTNSGSFTELGGTLIQDTTINQGGFELTIQNGFNQNGFNQQTVFGTQGVSIQVQDSATAYDLFMQNGDIQLTTQDALNNTGEILIATNSVITTLSNVNGIYASQSLSNTGYILNTQIPNPFNPAYVVYNNITADNSLFRLYSGTVSTSGSYVDLIQTNTIIRTVVNGAEHGFLITGEEVNPFDQGDVYMAGGSNPNGNNNNISICLSGTPITAPPSDGSLNNYGIITDFYASKGLVYAANYEANFTTYSLVDKGYVDKKFNGVSGTIILGTYSLTFTNGLLTNF